MREIKFRAWELKTPWNERKGQQMYYGVEESYDTLGSMTNSKGEEIEYPWSNFGEVIDYAKEGQLALMQYTGLKDKNAKEIYEGDLFKCIYDFDGCDKHIFEIIFLEGFAMFHLKSHGEDCHQPYVEKHVWDFTRKKIIGNIYENPELLINQEK